MKLKNVLTLSFGLQLICGQVSYPGMRSWFHPQSMAMAGGGNSISSMESDRLNPAALNSILESNLQHLEKVRWFSQIQPVFGLCFG